MGACSTAKKNSSIRFAESSNNKLTQTNSKINQTANPSIDNM